MRTNTHLPWRPVYRWAPDHRKGLSDGLARAFASRRGLMHLARRGSRARSAWNPPGPHRPDWPAPPPPAGGRADEVPGLGTRMKRAEDAAGPAHLEHHALVRQSEGLGPPRHPTPPDHAVVVRCGSSGSAGPGSKRHSRRSIRTPSSSATASTTSVAGSPCGPARRCGGSVRGRPDPRARPWLAPRPHRQLAHDEADDQQQERSTRPRALVMVGELKGTVKKKSNQKAADRAASAAASATPGQATTHHADHHDQGDVGVLEVVPQRDQGRGHQGHAQQGGQQRPTVESIMHTPRCIASPIGSIGRRPDLDAILTPEREAGAGQGPEEA